MRDFQTKSNVGALPDSNSATKYGGAEATALRTEAKNAVSRAGLSLSPQDGTGDDTTQLAQAQFINGVAASTFQAGGVADAITLTPVTGTTGLLLPPDYTTLDGMQGSFFAAFTNTGATTVSIGQTAITQFGVKKILDEAGADLVGGEIIAGARVDFIYDAAADGGSGAAVLRQVSAGTSPVFTESFTSAEQTITPAGLLTIPHGLSATPVLFSVNLVCKVAEYGYAINDELIWPFGTGDTNSPTSTLGVAIVPDGTNLNIRYADNFGLVFSAFNHTTGAYVSLTSANWTTVVRAWV